jgi:natural product biosynthesis luciferase-like monooxygenase protein/amino acid adenylation domain-containing protein
MTVIEASQGQTGPARRDDLLARIRGASGRRIDDQGIFHLEQTEGPASSAQARFWFLDQFLSNNSANTLTRHIHIDGPLRADALRTAFSMLVKRHDAFRTAFRYHDGTLMQSIAPSVEMPFTVDDFSHLTVEEQRASVLQRATLLAQERFDLSCAPLMRAVLIHNSKENHVLLIAVHHIISDGWSLGILLRELSQAYDAAVSGTTYDLALLPFNYLDYTRWAQSQTRLRALELQSSYWGRQLADANWELNLPSASVRNSRFTGNGSKLGGLYLSGQLYERLKEFVGEVRTTPFVVLLASFAVLLGRWCNQRDIVIGTQIAGRDLDGTENVVGCFLNTLALRVRFADDPTFLDLVTRVKDTVLDAFDNADLPFETIVQEVGKREDIPRGAALGAMFVMLDNLDEPIRFAGLSASEFDVPLSAVATELAFYAKDLGDRFRFYIEYSTDTFDESIVPLLWASFVQLLSAALQSVRGPVLGLSLVDQAEHRRLMAWAGDTAPYPHERQLHDLVVQQCAKTPDDIAVVSPDRCLTFRELNLRSNQLARHLHSIGVGPGSLVALCQGRTVDVVVAMLAVMKCGSAYVPLDVGYPVARLEFMIADSGANVLIKDIRAPTIEVPAGLSVIDLDDLGHRLASVSAKPLSSTARGHLAYVIYTSGSTGQPKATAIAHSAIVNNLTHMARLLGLDGSDVVAALAPLTFDPSVLELFLPLLVGAQTHLVPRDVAADGSRLSEYLAHSGITLLQATPSTWRMLFEAGWRPSPKLKVMCGGEPLSADLAQSLTAGSQCAFNVYGPTEATIWSATWRIDPEQPVAIGRPIANMRYYVVDEMMALVPVGARGELCIGGIGVADGYLGRPELTAERFVAANFGLQDECVYRTGDLVRWRTDGQLEYLGRRDNQVKIRGQRVELGEIEQALLRNPIVSQAVVAAREDHVGDQRLVAYVCLAEHSQVHGNSPQVASRLRAALRRTLPDYMVPTSFVQLAQMPLSPNGKVDRRALPDGSLTDETSAAAVATTRTEHAVVQVWRDVLHVRRAGIDDDFFEVGGHSLLAARLLGKLEQTFGVQLPLRLLFEAPTARQLATAIDALRGAESAPPIPPLTPDLSNRYQPFPLNDIQEAYWLGRSSDFVLGNVAAYSYVEFDVDRIDVARLKSAWRKLVKRHDALRTIVTREGLQKCIQKTPRYDIRVHDFTALSPESAREAAVAIRNRLSQQVLPTHRWPLFCLELSLYANGRGRVHFGIDLILCDAWSLSILRAELEELYLRPDTDLLPLPVTHRDYVLATRDLQHTPNYEQAWRHWSSRLSELPGPPRLPLALAPETISHPRFRQMSFTLGAADWDSIKIEAGAVGLTPTALVLAMFSDSVSLYSGDDLFTLNLTLFNRLPIHPDIDAVVGDFTSLLPLAIDNRGSASLVERAKRIQAQLWSDLDNRVVSGTRIMREWAKQQERGARPLLPVVFTSALGLSSLSLRQPNPDSPFSRVNFNSNQTPQVWLDFQVGEANGDLYAIISYVDELFAPGVVEGLFHAFSEQLAQALHGVALTDLPRPSPSSDDLLARRRANTTAAPAGRDRLEQLFLAQVPINPDSPAVISARRTLSYRDLERSSAGVATTLARHGVGPASTVAIAMEKGWEQVAAVLGVLRAGGAYVPIDPNLPAARISELLMDARAALVLTQPWLAQRLALPSTVVALVVDESCATEADGSHVQAAVTTVDDLAYVIYTSGSTGRPKGVMISHLAAANTILDVNNKCAIGPGDRVFGISSLSFDLSVWDIFGPLSAGGGIVIPDPSMLDDPSDWLAAIANFGVNIWNSVPAFMELLLEVAEEADAALGLRLAMLSGDWVPLNIADRIKARCEGAKVLAMGGATEAAIWSNYKWVEKIEPQWSSIPYGLPLANQTYHVLNENMRPCPTWTVGELYIGGMGLSLGYIGDEAQTAAVFLTPPEVGERIYKTGDLGRYLPNGEIEFLGRRDTQIKLGGFRVELGEIEAALLKTGIVEQTVVTAPRDARGRRRLAAYVVPKKLLPGEAAAVTFGLFFFADDTEHVDANRYALCVESARAADKLGLEAIWTPERHFTEVAAAYPNAAVMGAALAMVTERIQLRAGSVVLPLHDPIRVAEEWSVVDNLSNGRVGVSFASGWIPKDFIFNPAAYPQRHQVAVDNLQLVQRLWRGEEIARKNGLGEEVLVKSLPRPVQPELPIWLTASNTPSSFQNAGRLGVNLLTGMMTQNFAELTEHIQLYRDARSAAGLGSKSGKVSVMMHTFVAESDEAALAVAREPMIRYLRAHANLHEIVRRESKVPLSFGTDDIEKLIEYQADRYIKSSSLIGSPTTCLQAVQRLVEIGVDDIACLIDFGVSTADVLQSLPLLAQLAEKCRNLVSTRGLRGQLAASLPAYMVPATFVTLDALPLSSNGKVDRRALPLPNDLQTEAKYVPPRTPTEVALVQIWRDVLDQDRIGVQDDFFDLGGHSLSATRVVFRLRQTFGVDLRLRSLLDAHTVEHLASLVDAELSKQGRKRRPASARRRRPQSTIGADSPGV